MIFQFLVFKWFQVVKFSILRVFRYQRPIFNKIWPPFPFRQATFELFMILKRFKINMNLNSVIPNNGIYGINSCKNKRALVGALHKIIFFKIKMHLNEMSCMLLVFLYLVWWYEWYTLCSLLCTNPILW